MPKPKKPTMFIVAAVTDNPDDWKFVAAGDGKAMHFIVPLQGTKLDKIDIKFINNNLKAFLQSPEKPDNTPRA